ncbi:MAG TPA: NAD(P)/FAD-dependent oxidoreductase [Kofleriaceae bacterium]|nr:NAD(P)/FAD-dependent oxidoreductase [Kofleriaceae bacterium]
MSHRVAVVGAGTAGAAVAIALARAGHAVTVFERVAEPGPVGAGITIQPTGQAALAQLGLLDEIATASAPIDRLTCYRANGKILVDLPYALIDPALRGLGTHRGVLFDALFRALRATAATVTCGVHIAGTELVGDGRVVIDDRGERHGPFDLVIAADGGVCELHRAAPRVRSREYPWGALWFVAEDPGFSPERRIYQIVDGAHTLLGFLPTGVVDGKQVVSLFWSIRADRVDAWRAAGMAPWRDRVLALEPRAEAIFDQLHDLGAVRFARYRDVAMKPWHGDRIVFIGDAAHATSPQLGQGANLVIDALALADAIAAAPSVNAALAAYSAARLRHLQYYQFATRALTPWFQSDSRWIGWLRDRIFPTSRWLSPLRKRMTRTMVGIDRGLIRRPLPTKDLPRLTC